MNNNNGSYRPPVWNPVDPKTGEYSYRPPTKKTANSTPPKPAASGNPKPPIDPRKGEYAYKPSSTHTAASGSTRSSQDIHKGEYAYKPPTNRNTNTPPPPASVFGGGYHSTGNKPQTPVYRPPVTPKPQPPKKKKHTGLLVLLFIFVGIPVLCMIIGAISAASEPSYNVYDEYIPEYTVTETDIAEIQTADLTVESIEAPFLINGVVPDEAVTDCVAEVADYAQDLVEEGILEDYSNEGTAVWMQHESGLQTIYIPPKDGTLSFSTNDSYDIITAEPHAGTFEPQYNPHLDKNDLAATQFDNLSSLWNFTVDVDAQSVTTNIVKTFGENQIILWLGHGGWTSQTGACLISGELFDNDRFYTDKAYQSLFNKGYLVRTAGKQPRVVITPKFIEQYAGSMKNSVVFLGACHSGKGIELVRAFLDKGAQAVVATSDEIRVVYYTDMLQTMVNALCTRDASGQYNTFSAALNIARQTHGATDKNYPKGIGARVEIFGPDVNNLRISDAAAATPEPAVTPEPATPTPEPTATPVPVDVYAALSNYAAQFNYLNGTTGYTGAYTKTEYRNVYSCNVPAQPIAYTIADFDQDGTDELLIADSNSNQTVHLEMYEVSGTSVVCTSEIDLPTPIAGSAEDGMMEYFYFPRNGRLQICVSELSLANHMATGTILRCAGAVYDGSSFSYLGMAEVIGTAGEGDPFVNDMAALGIQVNLYDMLNGYTVATDYLQSSTVFCTVRYMCTISDGEWMTYQDTWFFDDSVTYVEISHIGFTNSLLG